MRRRMLVLTLAGALSLGACDLLMVDPDTAGSGLALSFSFHDASGDSTFYGDLTPVLEKVHRIRFRFTREGTARDTTVAGRMLGSELQARVLLHAEETMGWLEIRADLLSQQQRVLFTGQTLTQGASAAPTAHVDLVPVAETIEIPFAVLHFTGIGDTIRIRATAQFATGDPIEGAVIRWTSESPNIVEMLADGSAVSRGNGTARVFGESLGASVMRGLTVAQVPARFTGVAPADTTLTVGESFILRPFGEDVSGSPLLPGAEMGWIATGAVSVDDRGKVLGVSPGTGTVEAVLGTVRHEARITVVSP